jgi:predicted AAA+ superfamily ATPase
VDFIVDDMAMAVEAKSTRSVHGDHLKGLRELAADYPRAKKRIVVSLDPKPRSTEDGIEILPYNVFAERLWANDLLS